MLPQTARFARGRIRPLEYVTRCAARVRLRHQSLGQLLPHERRRRQHVTRRHATRRQRAPFINTALQRRTPRRQVVRKRVNMRRRPSMTERATTRRHNRPLTTVLRYSIRRRALIPNPIGPFRRAVPVPTRCHSPVPHRGPNRSRERLGLRALSIHPAMAMDKDERAAKGEEFG
jgi:hypothetical protein